MVRIEHCSPLHSIQDLGRHGYSRMGLSVAGAADWKSYAWANHLVSNPYGAPAFELPGGGFVATFTQAATLAVTGAYAPVTINGEAAAQFETLRINPGDTLRIAGLTRGRIAYLAISGLVAAMVYGSASTSRRDGLGQPLRRGDCFDTGALAAQARQIPRRFRPQFSQPLRLPLMTAHPEARHICQQGFQVTARSDRMGTRLAASRPVNLMPIKRSRPMPLGAVQIPPDGQPIVLGVDRQSTGGYPTLGCVSREALGALVQAQDGDWVQFEVTDIETAQARRETLLDFFKTP